MKPLNLIHSTWLHFPVIKNSTAMLFPLNVNNIYIRFPCLSCLCFLFKSFTIGFFFSFQINLFSQLKNNLLQFANGMQHFESYDIKLFCFHKTAVLFEESVNGQQRHIITTVTSTPVMDLTWKWNLNGCTSIRESDFSRGLSKLKVTDMIRQRIWWSTLQETTSIKVFFYYLGSKGQQESPLDEGSLKQADSLMMEHHSFHSSFFFLNHDQFLAQSIATTDNSLSLRSE